MAGNGDQVAAGDQIYANYLLVDFSGKVMKDTYRDPHPVKIDTSKIFAGLRQGIIDQRIGSRLLIGIPARLAHGEKICSQWLICWERWKMLPKRLPIRKVCEIG
ncbi:FKBP-type peptidyl-prolyl cis-trans isomerase [Arcanobacterium hippocoleae]|uniref:FKBP-type peptidyl-prolyl cis-trans isomerase n=1 Tax=Arcanobacterium hippocoleae TaxID=149017 RepID=UPI00333E3FD0